MAVDESIANIYLKRRLKMDSGYLGYHVTAHSQKQSTHWAVDVIAQVVPC